MKKINIIYQAHLKDHNLKNNILEYLKRLSKYIKNELILSKTNEIDIILKKNKKNKNYNICLSEEGEKIDTLNFAKKINELLKKNDYINFYIGEAEGLREELKKESDLILSLSNLTFTSEISLLILSEQLYRIFTILNKHPYHKG